MTSIAETSILLNIIELAKRCGVAPSQVDGYIEYIEKNKYPGLYGYYQIEFLSIASENPENTGKFFKLLGMTDTLSLVGPRLEDLEGKVARALSMAPRERSRGP